MMSRDMNQIATALLCVVALSASGCQWASSSRVSSLETQLRDQDARVIELTRTLEAAHAELEAASYESRILRNSLTDLSAPPTPEQTETSLRITGIEIVSLLSGGLDRDGIPGDELLTLLVSPRDAAGETLRTGGRLTIEVFDFAADGGRQQVGRWEFAGKELNELWHSGVIGRGFRLVDRWQAVPSSENVTVHVRLVTSDGRQFDKTGELTVSLPGDANRQASLSGATSEKPAARGVFETPEFEVVKVAQPTTPSMTFEEWARTRTLAEK